MIIFKISVRRLARTAFGAALAGTAVFVLAGLTHAQGTSTSVSKDSSVPASDTVVGRPFDAPVNTRPMAKKFWWDDRWYEQGRLDVPINHEVVERQVSYVNKADDTEVPSILFRPKSSGTYPAVLFQHGRRGLGPLVQNLARRMAARGFIVLAPNVYEARFLSRFPLGHKEETEGDVNAGVDFLLSLPDVSTSKICYYSHTRGGYYTLMSAVKFKQQGKKAACYVSFYPHWQNPNATEPEQVYRYVKEADSLTLPSMIFIGEYEQYQRRRSLETAVRELKKAGRDIKLIIYPGVGRGFDFRPARVRTFADDLATKDSNMRAARFMRRHLKKWRK